MITAVKFIFAVIVVEAVTEVVVKSALFEPVRKFFFDRNKNRFFKKVHELLDCGYCASVWVGCLTSLVMFRRLEIVNAYIDWFFIGVVLHRLSNFLHSILDYINKDKYKDIDTLFNGEGSTTN